MRIDPKQILRVPPRPTTIGLTDRDTGKVWYLKVDPAQTDSAGNPRLALIDTLTYLDQIAAKVYAAYEGPFLGRGVRLLMRGGRLGYEILSGYNVNSSPVVARGTTLQKDLVWYQLALPTSEQFTGVVPLDHLAYSLQTA